jgi:hypothetical protein
VVNQLLDAMQEGPQRCMMLHGIQHIPFEAFEDLIEVFEAYRDRCQENPRFNLLVAGTIAGDLVRIQGAGKPVVLLDFTPAEAVEALVEELGPLKAHRLREVVEVVGGIPQILEALVDGGEAHLSKIVANPESFWQVIGPLAAEIRGAFEIVGSDDSLHARLERLARDGPQSEDLLMDRQLMLAGVVNRSSLRMGRRMQIRSPAFAEYALNN